MSDSPAPARPMKYPYTFTARLAQFPFKFYLNNNWMYKYYLGSIVAVFPIFMYLHNLSNSPGNIRKFEESQRKQKEAEHH